MHGEVAPYTAQHGEKLRPRHWPKAKIDHRSTKIDRISGSSEFTYSLKIWTKKGTHLDKINSESVFATSWNTFMSLL